MTSTPPLALPSTHRPKLAAQGSAGILPGSSGIRIRASGFTLLEILIAVSLLTILATMLFQMVDASTKLWRENESGAESFREARAALGVISRELQSVLVHDATDRLPGVVIATADKDGKLPGGILSVADKGNALFFLGLLPQSSQGDGDRSDTCAIGYYLAYTRDPNPLPRSSRKLYRYFSGSNATFAAAKAALDPKRTVGVGLTNWPGAISDLFVPTPGVDSATQFDEILARHVADFTVRALTTENGTQPLGPKAAGKPWQRTDWPDAIELKITALTEEAATQLTETEWDQAKKPLAQQSPVFRKNARTFSTRVFLPVPAAAPPTPPPTPSPTP
jgi:prepilin-type N-terminal cleavage/methylation domain-containing protein